MICTTSNLDGQKNPSSEKQVLPDNIIDFLILKESPIEGKVEGEQKTTTFGLQWNTWHTNEISFW